MKLILTILCLALAPAAFAQSTASEASTLSLHVSTEIAALALQDGSRLVVTALRPAGESVAVSVQVAGDGASAVLHLSAAAIETTGLAAGTVLVAATASAGWILHAGGEAVAFIPSQVARSHIHRRRL